MFLKVEQTLILFRAPNINNINLYFGGIGAVFGVTEIKMLSCNYNESNPS